MSLLNFLKRKNSFNEQSLIVKDAFTCGGINYMEVDSVFKLPYQRGKAAVMIYEEMRMKCDYEYLKAYTTAINNIFVGGNKIGFAEISNIKKLNDQLMERLFKIVDIDIIYKLASVVFFDKNESPFEYDWEYAKKKIDHWKKYASARDFFLQEPLIRLIPFLKSAEENIEVYTTVTAQINKIDWDEVFSLLDPSQREGFSGWKNFYVKEKLQESTS